MGNAFIEDLVSAHHVIEGVNELGDRDYKPLSCHKLVEANLNNRDESGGPIRGLIRLTPILAVAH
jgi:hypothetical protein